MNRWLGVSEEAVQNPLCVYVSTTYSRSPQSTRVQLIHVQSVKRYKQLPISIPEPVSCRISITPPHLSPFPSTSLHYHNKIRRHRRTQTTRLSKGVDVKPYSTRLYVAKLRRNTEILLLRIHQKHISMCCIALRRARLEIFRCRRVRYHGLCFRYIDIWGEPVEVCNAGVLAGNVEVDHY